MSLIVWKNLKNLSVVIYSWLFWITLTASNYPLRHYDRNLNNYWSPNKQLKYLGRWGKVFIFQIFSNKTKLLASQRRFHETRHCTWDCYIRNINAQLGGDTQKQKFVQITVFPIIFVTVIWITKKHLFFVFKPNQKVLSFN